jgi:hypothetical protein
VRPVKQQKTAILVLAILGCEVEQPPPDNRHLAEDVKKMGDELLACKRAENERLQHENAARREEIARLENNIAAYLRILGRDAGIDAGAR